MFTNQENIDMTEKRDDAIDSSAPRSSHCYLAFICAAVASLKAIRDNPTTAKIDGVLIDLQALTMDQD